ncbi:hypothetical protein, partial [Paraburkholderia xenovorans]|uniref:hypothetical protein n=1 Tax=Paraburkholderia xenovorans TaxID=36873 RepID=UPI001C12E146
IASFTASSRNSFVYTALGIRFINASIPQFYGMLASTFFSRPQFSHKQDGFAARLHMSYMSALSH